MNMKSVLALSMMLMVGFATNNFLVAGFDEEVVTMSSEEVIKDRLNKIGIINLKEELSEKLGGASMHPIGVAYIVNDAQRSFCANSRRVGFPDNLQIGICSENWNSIQENMIRVLLEENLNAITFLEDNGFIKKKQ